MNAAQHRRWTIGLRFLIALATGSLPAAAAAAAEPVLINLRPVLNSAWEDDGITGNGAGGWSDKGVNDMYLWPPMPTGRGPHNGFPFDIVAPASNDNKGVLILAGKLSTIKGLPEQVDVEVPKATGRYLYLLLNETHGVPGDTDHPNPTILTVTLRYADGSTHEFALREGLEISGWWSYFKNPLHKPPALALVHLGENIVAAGQFRIGVWAARLENPSPEKPVVGLRFHSAGLASPCIFAATLSDEDYSSQAQIPKASLPPGNPPAPDGYFDVKRKQQDDALYSEGRRLGFMKGVRSSGLLRPDLVSITFDNALTRDMGIKASKFNDQAHWTISSTDDSDYKDGKRPAAVGHKCYERYDGNVGLVPMQYLYWNDFYVRFPTPMKGGCHYTVAVDGMEACMTSTAGFAYDPNTTITHAIKVNQVGYALCSSERWAYLGWWAGSLGAVDYKEFTAFEVLDEASGKSVHKGKIELRAAGDKDDSGEDVYQLDLQEIPSGRYHIAVAGLGRSEPFRIGPEGTAEAAFHTFRGFFHQRCGQELKPPYTPVRRPACHVECYESGFCPDSPNVHYTPKPGEAKRRFWGGYHDAGDFDADTGDTLAISHALMVYETHPEFFTDHQLNLPESGHGLPDILSEAKWAVNFQLENQLPDGNVPEGRGNDCDSWGCLGSWPSDKRLPFGILPPYNSSAPRHAAVAAEISVLMRKYDPAYADRLLKSALKALDYALQFKPEPYPISIDPKTKQPKPNFPDGPAIMCALGECYRATGNPKFAETLETRFFSKNINPESDHTPASYLWPLIRPGANPLPPAIADKARAIFLYKADQVLKKTHEPAYRLGVGKDAKIAPFGGASAGRFGAWLVRAHALTGDPKYLAALSLNYDFLFGVNPPAKTFVTSMGWNPLCRPLLTRFYWYKYLADHPGDNPLAGLAPPDLDTTMVSGIPIFGLCFQNTWYYPTPTDPGGPWPKMHSFRDVNAAVYSSEYGVGDIGMTSCMTLYLAAEDAARTAKK